jgi:large subunit ribosomal protein L15
LDTLQKAVDAGKLNAEDINIEALLKAGVVSKKLDGIRLLARGAITSKVNVTVNSASKSAVAAVEKAGGKVNFVA